jgi:hypothetical protein
MYGLDESTGTQKVFDYVIQSSGAL